MKAANAKSLIAHEGQLGIPDIDEDNEMDPESLAQTIKNLVC